MICRKDSGHSLGRGVATCQAVDATRPVGRCVVYRSAVRSSQQRAPQCPWEPSQTLHIPSKPKPLSSRDALSGNKMADAHVAMLGRRDSVSVLTPGIK